jgi:hypothetical protein
MEMIGKKFSRLTVLARGRSDSKHIWWVCRCSCGMDSEVRGDHLRLRLTRSCGCLHHQVMLARGHHYERGKKFGRLTVLKELAGKPRRYFCRCVCGEYVSVPGRNLASRETQSCGCLYRATRKTANRRHGKSPADHESAVYSCYIRERGWCMNPTDRYWRYYGARSIRFCFSSFPEFYAAVGDRPGPRHWLMRKDRDGNFEPGNLAWVERKRARK